MVKPALPKPDGWDFTTLKPSDIERLTGVSGAIQRAWRSKGLLAPREGPQARFDLFDAAAIAIRYRLSLQNKPPAQTREDGEKYAPLLTYHILLEVGGICEVLAASETRLDEVQASFRDNVDLVGRLTRLVSAKDADRFLIGAESGELVPASDVLETLDELRTPSGIFVDLLSLAMHFALHSHGALVTLRYDGVTRGSSPPPRRRFLKP